MKRGALFRRLLPLLFAGAALLDFAAPDPSSAGEASDMVLGLSFRGLHRAYPTDLFSPPRVINDRIRQQEVAVFHDPGAGMAVAYFRVVLGEPILFAEQTSGTIAEDLTTMTRWDLASGRAVAGNLSGMELVPLPLTLVARSRWIADHPDTTVFAAEPP